VTDTHVTLALEAARAGLCPEVRRLRSRSTDRLTPSQRYYGRREFVRNTSLGVLGLSVADLLFLEKSARAGGGGSKAQAKNVLVILEQGGLSHIDTWDPKPDLPAENRSPFKPIRTRVPGMEFTELLAKTARVADRLAVVRGMHHTVGDHPQGTAYMLQGNNPTGPLKYPDIGGVVSELIGSECSYLPPYIMIPGNSEQAYNTTYGFLSASRAAFKTGGADLSDPKWTVAGLQPYVGAGRIQRRRELLGRLDDPFIATTGSDFAQAARSSYEQAFSAITSPLSRAAFDFSTEPDTVREAYGKGHRGHCYLLGRKLVEAGVRFVTVDVRCPSSSVPLDGDNLNWDHHDNIYTTGSCGKNRVLCGGEGRYGIATWPMMGSTDQAFAALVEDMDQRGLLAETLICFITEFGRSPQMNKCHGRDHWPQAYSIVFAGAGIPGGQVIGETDKHGGEVLEKPHTPQDYAETIYRKLGIRTGLNLKGPGDRPIEFTDGGHPIPELF
jgi:hypothetical protein